jgi:hypothetical protein
VRRSGLNIRIFLNLNYGMFSPILSQTRSRKEFKYVSTSLPHPIHHNRILSSPPLGHLFRRGVGGYRPTFAPSLVITPHMT